MMDYSKNPRAQALAETLQGWLSERPYWYLIADASGFGQRMRTAEEVAADLALTIEQMDVQLASALESPDGELIRAVVWWVLPPAQRSLFDLFVEAVTIAAKARNRDQKIAAGVLTAFVVVAAGALIYDQARKAA